MDTMPVVVVPATSEIFIAKKKFICNVSRDSSKGNLGDANQGARVNIRYMSNEFVKRFLSGFGKIEVPISRQALCCTKHHTCVAEASIITELGDKTKVETTLSEMYYLMERQGEGGPGELFTNGHANTFYIRDQGCAELCCNGYSDTLHIHEGDGELCRVELFWGGNGWRICTSSIEEPIKGFMGFGLFLRSPFPETTEFELAVA